LIHGAQETFETVLLLDLFVDQKLQDNVANTFNSLEIHHFANGNLPYNHGGWFCRNCELPGVTRRVEIGAFIRNGVKRASVGEKRPHPNREASE
jgi:hypothetical protein